MYLQPAVFVPLGGSPADHLPHPRRPKYEPVEVIYAGKGEEYDGGPFLTYPSRRGWTQRDMLDPNNSGKPMKEILSFFQTWFFLGLLTDVFRRPVPVSDFIRKNRCGEPIITTKNLTELIGKWYDREQFLSEKSKEKYAMKVDQNLWLFCNLMNQWNLHGTAPFDRWTEIYLTMLGQYIETAYKIIYYKPGESPVQALASSTVPLWFSPNRRWSNNGAVVIRERMYAHGWCRSDLQRLESTSMTYSIYFASMLEVPKYKGALHGSIRGAGDKNAASDQIADGDNLDLSGKFKHQHCSHFSCFAYQYNEYEYKTKHISDSCTCALERVCVWDIIMILVDGYIPVIHVKNGVHVVRAMPGDQYVAISHVWADGLGNPGANSLPLCQLQRIARLVNNMYDSTGSNVPFWIDTLCCPLEPVDARTLAIRLIRKTYAEADKVLVVDSYLQSQSVTSASIMEILTMIFCSRWNRRLWTLNEKVLGRNKIYFQFNDMALQPVDIMLGEVLLMDPEDFCSKDPHRLTLLAALSYGFSGIPRAEWSTLALLDLVDASPIAAMRILQQLLPFRATTRTSDEAVCLGSLLNLNVQRILSAPQATRMEVFWSEVREIPPDVIFWIGNRLQKKGFRWAPSTFLGGRDLLYNNEFTDTGIARLTSKGLCVRFPGWMLGCQRGSKLQAQFFTMDELETVYMVSCIDGTSREYIQPGDSLDPWQLEPACISHSTLYLISQYDLDAAGLNGARVCHDALLVLAYGIEQDLLLVRSICTVTVRKLEAGSEDTECWRNCARKLLHGVEPRLRKLGLWSSSPNPDSDVQAIDLMGCSAVFSDHPWCVD